MPRRARFLDLVGAGGWRAREAMAGLGVNMTEVLNEAEIAAQRAFEQGANHATADDVYATTASRLMLAGAPAPGAMTTTNTSTTTVALRGPIGAGGTTPRAFLDSLPASGPVLLLVDSDGGDAVDGLVLAATISHRRASGQHFTARVERSAASAATAPVVAADVVEMTKGARLMVHDAFNVDGKKGTAADLRKEAGLLDGLSDQFARSYSARSGRPVSWWRAEMQRDRWISADEAVRLGLADRIIG